MDEEIVQEHIEEALALLFEQFWILREEQPEAYLLIRNHEQKLKRYIHEKFGLDLIVHQYFAKLEKIPVDAKEWMGITSFQDQMDYAIFCCALAYTEQKAIEEQFLLSDLAEGIKDLYPGDLPLDWTVYQTRRSLVRALQKFTELHVIKAIDGSIELFQSNEEEEVLYEVTVYARYYMRSYPDDLTKYLSITELLEEEWKRQPDDLRRKRVYRKLMMEPFVYRTSEDDLDFAYIRKYRHRLRDDLEQHSPFRLEVFKNVAMLTMPEAKQRYTLFPDTSGLADVTLHLAVILREHSEEWRLTEFGVLRLPFARLQTYVKETKERFGHGWAKKYRDMTLDALTRQIIQLWAEWQMVKQTDEQDDIVQILPGAVRMTAFYPPDYEELATEE